MKQEYPSGRRYPSVPEILAADDRIWAGHARLLAEAIIRYHEALTREHRRLDESNEVIGFLGDPSPCFAVNRTIENVQRIAEMLFPDWAQEEREHEAQQAEQIREFRAKQKKGIPGKLRKAVLERDGYRCQFCGDHRELCVDHKIPESKGGPTTLDNLQALCKPCNSRKCARVEPHPLALPVSERGPVTPENV